LDVRNFKVVEASMLKEMRWDHLQWKNLCNEFHKYPLIAQKF
jgi:hypothetical protein